MLQVYGLYKVCCESTIFTANMSYLMNQHLNVEEKTFSF